MNSKGTSYMLNDIDSYVVELHRQIGSYTGKSEELFDALFEIIDFTDYPVRIEAFVYQKI